MLQLAAFRPSIAVKWPALFATSLNSATAAFLRRFNNTTAGLVSDTLDKEGSTAETKRRQFRKTPPDAEILKYLDIHRLGYIARRRARVSVARNFEDGVLSRNTAGRPYPFHRNKGKLKHIASAAGEIPPCAISPEIAVIGRSNVGKSSLMNALLGFNDSFIQKAIVSPKPGETRALKFYGLGSIKNFSMDELDPQQQQAGGKREKVPALTFVDMPGYGFAYMNEDTQEKISQLVYKYLFTSPTGAAVSADAKNGKQHTAGAPDAAEKLRLRSSLKRVLMLVDARHGLKLADREFFSQLAAAHAKAVEAAGGGAAGRMAVGAWKVQVVLTKCDLVERTELCRRLIVLHSQLKELLPPSRLNSMLQLPIVPISLQAGSGGHSGIAELCLQLQSVLPKSVRIKGQSGGTRGDSGDRGRDISGTNTHKLNSKDKKGESAHKEVRPSRPHGERIDRRTIRGGSESREGRNKHSSPSVKEGRGGRDRRESRDRNHRSSRTVRDDGRGRARSSDSDGDGSDRRAPRIDVSTRERSPRRARGAAPAERKPNQLNRKQRREAKKRRKENKSVYAAPVFD